MHKIQSLLRSRSVFDFQNAPDRRHTYSIKWSIGEDEFPMFIADMDFKTAPAVSRAIRNKAALDVYGYHKVPSVFFEAVADWQQRRHGWAVNPSQILYCEGVMPGLASALRHLTQPGDKVVALSPVYHHFYSAVRDNARDLVLCPLDCEDGNYRINFARLEQTLLDSQAKLLMFCNPHNPAGIVWSEKDLIRLGQLCDKQNVLVFSDEIHADLTDREARYTPFAKASSLCARLSVVAISPSKAFNLAGLHTASLVIENEALREKVRAGLHADMVDEPNAFSIEATLAAYTESDDWLNELVAHLAVIKRYACQHLVEHCPGIKVSYPQASYLLWIDCSALTDNTDELADFLRETTGLIVTKGGVFAGNGQSYLRMNVAMPFSLLEEGLARFVRGWNAYRQGQIS